MNEQPSQNSSYPKDFKLFFWIGIIGFVLYFQAFFFDFSYLDDNNLILGNQYFLANFSNIFQSFLTDVFHLFNSSAFYYRPLLTISFIFDYQLGGASPFIYHSTNIALHIAATCLLFTFFKNLGYRKDLAYLFSLIFLVHPALTQAVAWIPGRNDSLLAVFILPTFIFFIKYLQDKRTSHLVWYLTFFGLALFTKESAVFALPIMLFYLCFIYTGKKLSPSTFSFFIGSIGVIALWALLRHFVLKDAATVTLVDMIKSVYFNLPATIQFVGKIFFPFNLSVLPIMQDTTFLYGIASIILLVILLFFTKTKRWNFILLGLGWFLIFLLPSFIRPNPNLVADFIEHRLYVPLIGFFIILLETDLVKKIDIQRKSILIMVGGLLLFLSIITLIHSRNFSDRLAFWRNATEHSPHYPLAHRNLGAMEYLDGDMDNAEKEFRRALELNPSEAMAHNNLGLVYTRKNKLAEAEDEYKKELEVNPFYDDAYFNLGLLYFGQERYEEALNSWKKTVEINPNYIDALKALAIYYYDQKNYKEATIYVGELYKRGLVLPPELLKLLQPSTMR